MSKADRISYLSGLSLLAVWLVFAWFAAVSGGVTTATAGRLDGGVILSSSTGCGTTPVPDPQSGYQTALADNLQDLQDLTAVLDSSDRLVAVAPVGTGGSCWALVYCDPTDVNSACYAGP